jgi:hypothetical protein
MTQWTDAGSPCAPGVAAEAAGAAAPPLPLARGARWLVLRLSNDNPFYVLSALLVLLGLWTSFGAQVRPEQTWALMFGLAGYTLLLAGPACLLVRFGGVWEDVRTVLLLVVLMFLATSVTFDETLGRDPELGQWCSALGLLFAVAVSEGMLRAMRLALPRGFRVPYYLALALFFVYPAALVPLLDRPKGEALQWALYGFAPAAGLVALTLLPAARRGAEYVRENGSPWPWPYYPWALFVFLGVGVLGRSYLLCWSMQHVERSVPERLIFGPHFLAPFVLAVGAVLLEAGRAAGSRGVLRAALLAPAAAVVMSAVGHRGDNLYQGFLALYAARLGGTPLYLALLASAGFYAYAAARRVPRALGALTASMAALAVVGPESVDLDGLVAPQPAPLLAAAVLQLTLALRRRSGGQFLAAVALLAAAVLADDGERPVRVALAFHVVLGGVLAAGAATGGPFGRALRTLGSILALFAALAATSGRLDAGGSVPRWAVDAYPPAVAVGLAAYGAVLGHGPAVRGALLALAAWAVAYGWRGYASLRHAVVGLDAIVVGLVLLALAHSISLAKAGLLPGRLAKALAKYRRALE